MFREMRRKDRQLTEEQTVEILKNADHGVLAVDGDDGYPYAVPVSYAYTDGKIIFHGAKSGQKLDALKRNPKCSLAVIAGDDIEPSEFGTYFSSAIVFGKARILENPDEIFNEHMYLVEKYSKDFHDEGIEYFEKMKSATAVVVIDIEHMTGKAKIRAAK